MLKLLTGMLLVAAAALIFVFLPTPANPVCAAMFYCWLTGAGVFGMVLCEDYIQMNKD